MLNADSTNVVVVCRKMIVIASKLTPSKMVLSGCSSVSIILLFASFAKEQRKEDKFLSPLLKCDDVVVIAKFSVRM